MPPTPGSIMGSVAPSYATSSSSLGSQGLYPGLAQFIQSSGLVGSEVSPNVAGDLLGVPAQQAAGEQIPLDQRQIQRFQARLEKLLKKQKALPTAQKLLAKIGAGEGATNAKVIQNLQNKLQKATSGAVEGALKGGSGKAAKGALGQIVDKMGGAKAVGGAVGGIVALMMLNQAINYSNQMHQIGTQGEVMQAQGELAAAQQPSASTEFAVNKAQQEQQETANLYQMAMQQMMQSPDFAAMMNPEVFQAPTVNFRTSI